MRTATLEHRRRRTAASKIGLAWVSSAAIALIALAAPAYGETRMFLNDTVLFPVGGAGNVGPANAYPASIPISGLSGTVTDVNVTLIGYESGVPDDNDVVLVGPNGDKVMVMSDACGTGQNNRIDAANYVFDDAAPTFLSNNGPCPQFQRATFKPSNYLGEAPEPDDLSADGGPAPPYTNALSAFNGISPNGNWDLFVRDDNDAVFGFSIAAWALTLEIEPPPDTTPPDTAPAPTASAPPSPTPAPANTAKPQLSGKAKSGKTLTCAAGAWTGSPSFAYAWLRNGDPIAGETATTLELRRRDAGRAVQCEVTATGAGGTAVEQSKPVVPKKQKPKRSG